jgi:hypothetical protein
VAFDINGLYTKAEIQRQNSYELMKIQTACGIRPWGVEERKENWRTASGEQSCVFPDYFNGEK